MEEQTNYPVDVYLNGKKVGTMNRRGEVTFTDNSAAATVLSMMESKAVGLSAKDAKGNTYKDGSVHFTTLSQEEEVKMEKHRINMARKKGRIL